MSTILTVIFRHSRFVGVCVAYALFAHAIPGEAMDFETSTEVASCMNRPGFEREGQHAVELLRKRGIQTVLSYIKIESDGPYTTGNAREATKWVIYVNTKHANEARKVLSDAVKTGLLSIHVFGRAKVEK